MYCSFVAEKLRETHAHGHGQTESGFTQLLCQKCSPLPSFLPAWATESTNHRQSRALPPAAATVAINRWQEWGVQRDEGDGDGNGNGGLEIETMAGILLASIFAFFILTYTVFLQCWWKCRSGRRREKAAKATAAAADNDEAAGEAGDDCSCFAQTVFSTWERVDVDKMLAERTCNVNR